MSNVFIIYMSGCQIGIVIICNYIIYGVIKSAAFAL